MNVALQPYDAGYAAGVECKAVRNAIQEADIDTYPFRGIEDAAAYRAGFLAGLTSPAEELDLPEQPQQAEIRVRPRMPGSVSDMWYTVAASCRAKGGQRLKAGEEVMMCRPSLGGAGGRFWVPRLGRHVVFDRFREAA